MKKNKRLKIFVMLFFSIGLINSYILIMKNEPYDLSRTYGFVEYTHGSNELVLRSGEKVFLWGVSSLTRDDPKYRDASMFLTHKISEQNVSILKISGSNDKEPFAKVFLSDGSDVSNIMIERGLLYEDCNVTKGFYGTCIN